MKSKNTFQATFLKIIQTLKKDKISLICFCVFFLICFLSLTSSWFLKHSPNQIYEEYLNLPPIWKEGGNSSFLLGTDDLGRDFMSRLFYGGKISLMVGFLVMIISLFFGCLLGVIAGYFKKMDPFIMGMIDTLMSFPGILIAIIVIAVLSPSLFNACIAVSVMSIPPMFRLVRSLVLREKGQDYVQSSISFGAHPFRVIFYHILPNSFGEISVQAILTFSEGILSVAALSFLGLGAQPPLSEWGSMIADGRAYIESSWWLVTFPGICILVLILCINILGERLRDVFDTKWMEIP
ncbi:MAG: ABC transporter permease [Bdellovibrionales bacterium]